MLAVVSDSSPLLYLTRLGRFDLLRQLYEGVFISNAVWREVAIEGAARPEGMNVRQAVTSGWLKVASAPGTGLPSDPAYLELGDGERVTNGREVGVVHWLVGLRFDGEPNLFVVRQHVVERFDQKLDAALAAFGFAEISAFTSQPENQQVRA